MFSKAKNQCKRSCDNIFLFPFHSKNYLVILEKLSEYHNSSHSQLVTGIYHTIDKEELNCEMDTIIFRETCENMISNKERF